MPILLTNFSPAAWAPELLDKRMSKETFLPRSRPPPAPRVQADLASTITGCITPNSSSRERRDRCSEYTLCSMINTDPGLHTWQAELKACVGKEGRGGARTEART
jgi:hypothetical protein